MSLLKVKISGLIPKLNSTVNNNDDKENNHDDTDASAADGMDEFINSDDENSMESDGMDDSVAGVIWNALTPRTKGKVMTSLQNEELPKGLSYAVRKAIKVNLSNKLTEHVPYSSALCKAIEEYFERDDVSRLCPDTRNVCKDPSDANCLKQIRWRLGYLNTLHSKFIAESEFECSYQHFARYVPFHIRKSDASDWGTCLCKPCINPELKVERLVRLGKLSK